MEIARYLNDPPLERIGEVVLIAFETNGTPLKLEHGFPVRLAVLGFHGANSVKCPTKMSSLLVVLMGR
jgi:DMSO/TMAO reductase YedYZ molybdopterin-dependent catalytic subunit